MAILPRRDSQSHGHSAAAVWPLVAVLASTITIYLLYWWFVDWLHPPADTDGAGTFGDKFGGLNALFSAFAFAGIFYTIILQRREIQHQRQQLRIARAEQQRQDFERIAFRLLELHTDSVNALRAQAKEGVLMGREVFEHFADELTLWETFRKNASDQELLDGFWEKLRRTDLGSNPNIWPYTQNLLALLAYVDRSSVEGKELFLGIFRAQLSAHELLWIFSYCLAPLGKPMRDLVERLAVLENWDWSSEMVTELRTRFFAPSAFGQVGHSAPDSSRTAVASA